MTNRDLFDTIIQFPINKERIPAFTGMTQNQMKTKVKIKKIEDKDTEVVINSPEHRIWEIKKQIAEDSYDGESVKVEVFEMWSEEES